jgi:predicted phosphodiesterase
MGYHFELEHANIVAFVTTPNTNRGYKEPVITESELENFLTSLNTHNLLSSSIEWLHHLIHTANRSLENYEIIKRRRLELNRLKKDVLYDRIIEITDDKRADLINKKENNEKKELELIEKRIQEKDIYIKNRDLKQILEPIRYILSDFELFGVAIFSNNKEENSELLDLSTQYAQGELENALILIPNNSYQDNSYVEILSAAKPFSILSNINSTGMLFWDKKNNSKFIPLEQLKTLIGSNRYELHNFIANFLKNKIENFFNETSTLSTILHLSDLHFGNEDVSTNLNYLLSHLKNIKGIEHIVITGDLIENPDTSNCHLFKYFVSELSNHWNVPISMVAGNHDHKKDGWRNLQSYRNCDIKLSDKVDVNHNIKTIFFCIDSTIDGDTYFARGNVSREQLVEIGEEYENKKREYGSKIETYNKIALIHHHPFAFTYEDTTNYIKKAKFYMHDKTLELRNADEIIQWCSDINIDLILHGHKHLQRYVECEIQKNGTATNKIDSIGCGTSTGTKGNHLSYNLISLNSNKTYNYSFFRGKNNASGFYPEYLKIYKEKR